MSLVIAVNSNTSVSAVESGSFALMQTHAASQASTQAALVKTCRSYKESLAQVRSAMDALLVENGSLKEKLITLQSQYKQYEAATTANMKALEEENAKCKAFLQEKEAELVQVRGENAHLKEENVRLNASLFRIRSTLDRVVPPHNRGRLLTLASAQIQSLFTALAN